MWLGFSCITSLRSAEKWVSEDVVKREEKAKEILRRKLAAYKIVVVPTDRLEELEEKLIKALRPRPNPPRGRR